MKRLNPSEMHAFGLFVLAEAARKRSDAGYSGAMDDGGAQALEDLFKAYSGEMPSALQTLFVKWEAVRAQQVSRRAARPPIPCTHPAVRYLATTPSEDGFLVDAECTTCALHGSLRVVPEDLMWPDPEEGRTRNPYVVKFLEERGILGTLDLDSLPPEVDSELTRFFGEVDEDGWPV